MHYRIVPGAVLHAGDMVMNKTEKDSVLKEFAFGREWDHKIYKLIYTTSRDDKNTDIGRLFDVVMGVNGSLFWVLLIFTETGSKAVS